MSSVGVRELRENLRRYLRRVRDGESLIITHRGKPIAELAPTAERRSTEQARALVRKGVATWSGEKPRGLARAPRPSGGLVSDAVIQDRRGPHRDLRDVVGTWVEDPEFERTLALQHRIDGRRKIPRA